jgi:hypothetical protein
MKECVSCRRDLEDAARFCDRCGRLQPQPEAKPAVRVRAVDAQSLNKARVLNAPSWLVVLIVSMVVNLFYWGLLPYGPRIFDPFTHVATLWDPGFYQTVAFEYSKLAVENHVFPYTAALPGYPFTTLEYPFLAGYLFYAIYAVAAGAFTTYVSIIQSINVAAEIGNVVLVYLIAKRFVSDLRAVLLAVLYSLTPSMLFFTVSRYDAISAFFSLLAVAHFLSGRYKLASAWAGVGFLLRYYPAILIIFFIKHGLSNRLGKKYLRDVIMIPALLSALTLVPLLLLSPSAIPREFLFSANFGWNWESVWGPIDRFVRFGIPSLAFFYDNQIWMRIAFAATILLSVLLLRVKNKLDVVAAYAFTIICWLNTAWLFSPQYAMWIYPLLVAMSRTKKFLALTLGFGALMTLELPSPFFYVFPVTQFYLVVGVSALRVLTLWALALLLLLWIRRAMGAATAAPEPTRVTGRIEKLISQTRVITRAANTSGAVNGRAEL